MLVIDDKIISEDIISEQFVCDLMACKGECCVAGDIGAPLDESEKQILEDIYETVKPYLLPDGIKAIEEQGKWVVTEEDEKYNTPLMPGGGCAYINYDEHGIVICGIEKAFLDGKLNYKKPISCHLYPIRVSKQKKTGNEMINYERWNICKAACKNGKKLKVPVFKFLKEPIIRKWGVEFYEVLLQFSNQ